MTTQHEIERMLKEHNAVLVRQKNHMVYRLPNGQTFVMPKTPGDHRAMNNTLRDLRHALGTERVVAKTEGVAMPIVNTPAPAPAPASTTTAPAAPAPEEPKPQTFKDRMDAAIAAEESRQEKLLAVAQQVERRVQMLKALLPFADDPAADITLRRILAPPAPEPPQPPAVVAPPPPPPPPEVITSRVQVTRDLVLAATQTFMGEFTVNDVLDLMTGGRQIAPPERFRVRSSIAQAMVGLCDRGELVRVAEGIGKRQTIWQRAVLNGSKAVGRRA